MFSRYRSAFRKKIEEDHLLFEIESGCSTTTSIGIRQRSNPHSRGVKVSVSNEIIRPSEDPHCPYELDL